MRRPPDNDAPLFSVPPRVVEWLRTHDAVAYVGGDCPDCGPSKFEVDAQLRGNVWRAVVECLRCREPFDTDTAIDVREHLESGPMEMLDERLVLLR